MTWVGLACWIALFYPAWSPRCRRIRKQAIVSRNEERERQIELTIASLAAADESDAAMEEWGVGPDWVQDEPYPELFDEEDV